MPNTKYDTTSATTMLRQFAGENDATKRKAAADELRVVVRELLHGGRFYADQHQQEKEQLNLMRGQVLIGTMIFNDEGVHLRTMNEDDKRLGAARLMKLRYDVATDRLVGTEEDTTRHPTPGAERTYRDAVTVIVDEFCTLGRASIDR